jgi:hypothetical protein
MGNVELPVGISELERYQNFLTSSFDSLLQYVRALSLGRIEELQDGAS